ncbi:purine-nucleoside phosphorylase [Mesorhizobium sp. CAU 1741]|uniref:purine-nucleoside phosphorylase n=1 Tax=Mesorhizobium sp. CAU 1741 TaxID=3140366 RepID=UPI00325BA257
MNTETPAERVARAHASISERAGAPCEIALVLGSGLGQLADAVSDATVIPYGDIEGFPVSTAPGHKGQLVIGTLYGRRTVIMQGRLHLYEGWHPRDIALAVYLLKALGAGTFVVTNAAGGLNADFDAGDVMLIEDHLNLTGTSPLIGHNDESIGLRFPDQSRLYDPALRVVAQEAAAATGTDIRKGIYCGLNGPELETSAERRFYRSIGCDAVGMSTVMEVIAANHAGMKVLGLSAITNAATGGEDQEPDTIEAVVAMAAVCGVKIETILRHAFPTLPKA